jgi:DNA-binding NtrC family response regulator
MPPSTQVKLLRVLESRSFFRVGGSEPIRVDVRVVTATNRSLKESVALGEFREDLFFRLNVLTMYLPPLRERRSDIPILVKRFIKQFSEEHNRSFRGITAEAMQLLMGAPWPGNVRELRNLIESMVVLAPGQEIRASDIPTDVREGRRRLLPIHVPGKADGGSSVGGKELEFIFRTLVELKLQIEELQRRMDHAPSRHAPDMIEVGRHEPYEEIEEATAIDLTEEEPEEESGPVLYRPGMTMVEVERAAIEGALRDTRGNRREAAEHLGIGERTLYRKIKEYGLREQ